MLNPPPITPEKNYGLSKTIPNDTMSIKTIMERYARGQSVGGAPKVQVYESVDDEDFSTYVPDPRTLDLADVEQMKRETREYIDELNDKTKKAREAAKKAKAEAPPVPPPPTPPTPPTPPA